MALLKKRRNMSDSEWSNYQAGMLQQVDPSLRGATEQRFNKTQQVYQQATTYLNETIVLLNQQSGNNRAVDSNGNPLTDVQLIKQRNPDAELEAYNRLYEHYLRESQRVRQQLQQPNANKDQLTIELNELQSKALFFANEAYHTRQAAMHVVLNQQLNLGVAIELEDYLVSINEQIGFAMEQISATKGLGTSLWKSAKYVDRVSNAIEQIKEISRVNASEAQQIFTPETLTRIERVQQTSDELVKVKKGVEDYYNFESSQQSNIALGIGRNYPFPVNSVEELRAGLLQFSIEINSQIRNALPQAHNTNSSQLNRTPEINPQQLEQFYRGDDNQSSQLPQSDKDMASSSYDWDLEVIA